MEQLEKYILLMFQNLKKIMEQLKKYILLMFQNLKKIMEQLKKYILLMFQNNSNCSRQVILLIMPNRKKWNYLAVKKPSALLRGITSKH